RKAGAWCASITTCRRWGWGEPAPRGSTAWRLRQLAQEARQVRGDVVDVVTAGAVEFPGVDLVVHETVAGDHLHGGHAALVRDHQVLFEIVEHGGAAGVDAVLGKE